MGSWQPKRLRYGRPQTVIALSHRNIKMRLRSLLIVMSLVVWPLAGAGRTQNPADLVVGYGKFKEPPAKYRGHR